MDATMMDVPLSLNHVLERAGRYFGTAQVVTRLPDKSVRTHSYAEIYREVERTPALACIVLKPGEQATLAELAPLLDAHLLQAGFAKWQLPDRDEVLEALPRTSTGKFYKLALRERFRR